MDKFDRMVDLAERTGMDKATARRFAIGRHASELEAREAWALVESTAPAPSAETRGYDADLRDAYERAMRVAQNFGGMNAGQAEAMIRRRMADACHAVVTESTKPAPRGRR